MTKMCQDCVWRFADNYDGKYKSSHAGKCCLTMKKVNTLMVGCSLFRSEQDQAEEQLGLDEAWRIRPSLPLASAE